MDFFNTRNGLGKNTLTASEGVLHSINAVEVADRTRVILNLDQNAVYQSEVTDNGLTLILDPDAVSICVQRGVEADEVFKQCQ